MLSTLGHRQTTRSIVVRKVPSLNHISGDNTVKRVACIGQFAVAKQHVPVAERLKGLDGFGHDIPLHPMTILLAGRSSIDTSN